MMMHFCEALRFILNSHTGCKVARKAWTNPDYPYDKKFICKGYNDGKYFINFKYISPTTEKHMLYTPSQEDMTSEDWYIVEN